MSRNLAVTILTAHRTCTGADFDVESIQITRSGTVFIGDEFGPYIIEFDSKGRALAYYDIPFNGTIVRSPDSPDVSLNNPDGGAPTSVNLRRSRGFEGMAQSPDGQ